jgi:hypothetical protein
VSPRPPKRRRLVVPLVLAVTTAGTVAGAISAASGCHSDKPHVDAGGDAPADVPII